MSKDAPAAQPIQLGGYAATKDLVAQQVVRGGKTVYIVSLPIQLVPVHLAVPDPGRPIDVNRAVSKAHAESFGKYWLEHPGSWTVPPILVDTAQSLPFEPRFEVVNGPKIGVVQIPDYSSRILRTLDGQHRILGWALVRDRLLKEDEEASSRLLEAQRSGTPLEQQVARKKLEETKLALSRLDTEQVTLEIISMVSDAEHKTFFVTIADNAQGINKSERARLDEVNMTSRVARSLADSVPLLSGRIEERKASAGKNSKDLMSLANLRDIVRHITFGIKGKVTLAREQQINDKNAQEIAERFFDAMAEASPELGEIVAGVYLPKTLKKDSLLGSITIWRCLAGTYHNLVVTRDEEMRLFTSKEGHEKFVTMAREATKRMKITGTGDSRKIASAWYDTGCFNPGELSPRSRAQDLNKLTMLFTAWAESGKVFDPAKITSA